MKKIFATLALRLRIPAGLLLCFASAEVIAGAIPLVENGRPAAVIVIADRPTAVARYAAEELVTHVELATGVRPTVVAESAIGRTPACCVYVGDGRAVRSMGIAVEKLPPEAFVLRTNHNSIVIAGDDGGGDPLDPDTRAGTLWGVYECLDRSLGVRWLWPGPLGTHVPKNTRAALHFDDAEVAPRFFQRRLRTGTGFTSEHPALGFSPEAQTQYSREQSVYLRRHRMGRSYPLGYRHAFEDWWKKYGVEHPEWFQLRDSGTRGPSKPAGRYSMCVSNPEFQKQIIENWEASRIPGAKFPSFLNACENDIPGLCVCEACRACDGPEPADFLTFYPADSKLAGTRFVSDRYARFWLNLQQQAAKTDPDVTVVGYAYFNYFSVPTSGIRLNANILLGFCPTAGWFPRSAEEQVWMKTQWSGWRKTGARLFLRTNHLLDGYCMPYIFAHQFADEFQHAVGDGLVATDLDSLTGHWATQGPNLYVAARLHVRPESPVDEVLGEYYAAFGPAATDVKAYFDYWERYTTENRLRIDQAMDDHATSRWRNWAKVAHVVYPPACFPPAEAILARATKSAATDPAATERVGFLQLGLSHARLCAEVAGDLSLARATGPKNDETQQAFQKLSDFRRSHERSGIANFNHLAWVEDLSWKLPAEAKTAPPARP